MKVVLTDQSLERLEKSLLYYLEELEIPKVKVAEIKNKLLKRAKSLSGNHTKVNKNFISQNLIKRTEG